MQVIQWLSWAIREFSLEGVVVSNFAMYGKEICKMGREAFLSRAPPFMGDILWEHLEILQRGKFKNQSYNVFIDHVCDLIFDNFVY